MIKKTFYEILEISENASKEVINNAYKTLAKKYHPDTADDKTQAEEKMKELNEAKETLMDDEKRKQYDTFLRQNRDKKINNESVNNNEVPPKKNQKETNSPKTTTKTKNHEKKFVLLAVSILLIIAILIGGSAILRKNDNSTVDDTTTAATTDAAGTTGATTTTAPEFDPPADPNLEAVSVKSANFTLSNADMSYLFQNAYQEVLYQLSQSGMTPASVGLDTNASLKMQKCSVDKNSETWFDYFLNASKAEAKQLLALAEAAKAAGFELTDEDNKLADDTIAEIKEYAEQNNSNLEDYITLMYGKSVNEATVRKMISLTVLTGKYLDDRLAKVDTSDAALEEIYTENRYSYETVDYVVYGFDYKDILPENATDADIAAAKAEMNTYAAELAKCRDKDSFLAYAVKNMTEVLGLTDAEAEKAKEQLISKGVKYSSSSEVTKWAFDAEIGDIHTEESPGGDSGLTLYLLTGKSGRSDANDLHSVRHILFLSSTYKDDTKAREVYDAWVADGADVDKFIELVGEYSEDPGSVSAGGLYEGVYEGQMVDEFNDWVFDPARKHGDHGIVKTSYGWHIMFYEEGYSKWKHDMKQKLLEKEYTAINAEIEKATGITFDDALLATISA